MPKALDLATTIRPIPDFPKPGILFRDITTLLADPKALRETFRLLEKRAKAFKPTKILGIESRGFIFGAALADRLGIGFAPIRKPGKLPYKTVGIDYALEYGTDRLEMHVDAIAPGDRVLVVDDLLATGGTAAAVGKLVKQRKSAVSGYLFVIELAALAGRKKLRPAPVESLVIYE